MRALPQPSPALCRQPAKTRGLLPRLHLMRLRPPAHLLLASLPSLPAGPCLPLMLHWLLLMLQQGLLVLPLFLLVLRILPLVRAKPKVLMMMMPVRGAALRRWAL